MDKETQGSGTIMLSISYKSQCSAWQIHQNTIDAQLIHKRNAARVKKPQPVSFGRMSLVRTWLYKVKQLLLGPITTMAAQRMVTAVSQNQKAAAGGFEASCFQQTTSHPPTNCWFDSPMQGELREQKPESWVTLPCHGFELYDSTIELTLTKEVSLLNVK